MESLNSAKTKSEILFEQFCYLNNIECNRIDTSTTRTPDYEINTNQKKIIIEVKELTPNNDDREWENLEFDTIGSAITCTPGDRVRIKIRNASPQLKAGTDNGKHPSILVLYGDGMLNAFLSDYEIRVAMYGFEQYNYNIPNDKSLPLCFVGSTFGSKKTMRETEKRYISAIAVMKYEENGSILLSVYHNCFAINPILLTDLPATVKHYRLKQVYANRTPVWECFSNNI